MVQASIEVQVASNSQQLPQQEQFVRWCELALQQRDAPAQLCIRIVDEDEGRELNLHWRGKDYATNVLSFTADIPAGVLDIELLGDLVICAPVVERQAAEQNKQLLAHWAHMVIHGCLHLQGHDHQDDAQAEQMESLERQLLQQLGYDDPYAQHDNTKEHAKP